MERLTLDRQGARRGELFAASLQLADDTIAIQRIATMSIQDLEFRPWDTPANRKAQGVYWTFFIGAVFFAAFGILFYYFGPSGEMQLIGLFTAGICALAGAFFALQGVRVFLRLQQTQAYFQLLIGTSDGRMSQLVDNNRGVLTEIRDVVRKKMDHGDRDITGTFDLELDLVQLTKGSASQPVTVDVPAPDA